jgi:hypothetical protein
MIHPVEFHWDGKVMVPQPRFHALCRKQYTEGECYTLGVNEERSQASHRHYFACINEAWRNLPEDKVERYPSPEHLRKWALIKAGYHNENSIVCESRRQAEAIVSLSEALDEFSIAIVKGAVVKVYTAKSQSVENMTRTEFEKSKADVLAVLSETIGVTTRQLEQEGKKESS